MTRSTTTSMNNFCTPMASLRINSGLSSSSPFIAPNPNPNPSQRQRLLSKASLSFKVKEGWRHSMFVNGTPVLEDGNLRMNGKDALTGVPGNVVVTPFTNTSAFVGATAASADSRHVFKLGVIQNVRLLSLFRFTIWWMIPRMGNSASDIPIETQMLLLEASEKEKGPTSDDASTSYILFLPVLDGEFRSSLQGNSSNELEFCIESGNPDIVTSESLRAVFVNFGDNPFDLVKESMKILETHLGTFSIRETKQLPGMLDWFGWCTWDAFYQEVNPQGIKDGLKSLSEGGTPAKFLIIDDGWQDTTNEFQIEGEPFAEGSQFGGRLVSIKENNKFRGTTRDDQKETSGLKDFVLDIKKNFCLKYVYVWHALMGYWGGLVLNSSGTKMYNPEMKYPVQSPGNLANMRDLSIDCMEKYGLGAIDPDKISQFYDDLHKYLVSQGVDGVKVDVQNILETICSGLGSRVSLTRQFQQALEASIATNFKDNSIICCMAQNTDSIFHSKRSAITRASDDYYPKNPTTQTLHIAAVAFNSIFLGEMVVPDWDMFYSQHCAAEFHAVARAVGGCGVYVSDKPGKHDFKILKRLVLADGSVLRAKYPGRPSRDCLFNDPVMDGKSLLKIWNLNKCTGAIGVFNCQGAGSWPCMEKESSVQENVDSVISGKVSPADVEYLEEVSGEQWTGDCAVFSFNTGSLFRLAKAESFGIALKVMQCDVFTVSPIKVYQQKVQFAPIGLTNMYNSGGAVESVDLINDASSSKIHIKGRGGGSFGAYSRTKPSSVLLNSNNEEFKFSAEDNLLTVTIPPTTSSWDITLCY